MIKGSVSPNYRTEIMKSSPYLLTIYPLLTLHVGCVEDFHVMYANQA